MIVAAAAAGTADTTALAAFAVGFISFVSPCVLPLVPGYLSAVSGVSVTDMQRGTSRTSAILWPAVAFCLTFTVVFVALGMSATGIGSTLNDHRGVLEHVAGAIIVVLGAYFVLSSLVPRLGREWRVDALMERAGSGGPLVAGAAFAIAWTPCVGPTLGSILTAAATQRTVSTGGVLLACYSLGLAIPFLVTAVAFSRATTAFGWLKRHYAGVNAISGLILIGFGVLLLTGELATLNVEARRLMDAVGLGDLYNL